MAENVEITAKLKLDTAEAESKMKGLAGKKPGVAEVQLPKGTKIELPKETTQSLKDIFTGPKGLLNIAKVAKSARGGIQGLSGSLTGILSKAPKVAGIITLVLAAISAIIKLASGTDSFKLITESMEDILQLFKLILAPILAYTAEVTTILSDLLLTLKPVFDTLSNLLKFVLTPILAVIKLLGIAFKVVLSLLTPVLELINQLSLLLAELADSVLAQFIDMLDVLVRPLITLMTLLSQVIKMVFAWVKDLFGIGRKSLFSTTGQDQGQLKTALDTWQTSGDKVSKGEQEIIDTLEDGFSSFDTNIGDYFKNLPQQFQKWAHDSWDAIKNEAIGIWEGIKNSAVNVWQVVSSVAVNVWSAIADWGRSSWEAVTNFASIAWSAVLDFFKPIAQWFENLFKGIGEGVVNAATSVGSALGNAVSSVGNWFKNLFGFADGGTIGLGAQVWGMNEQGNPEFIFNSGGHDTVINKEILSDAMYQALVRANDSSTKRIEVSVKEGTPSGPRELAQWLLPSLKFSLK